MYSFFPWGNKSVLLCSCFIHVETVKRESKIGLISRVGISTAVDTPSNTNTGLLSWPPSVCRSCVQLPGLAGLGRRSKLSRDAPVKRRNRIYHGNGTENYTWNRGKVRKSAQPIIIWADHSCLYHYLDTQVIRFQNIVTSQNVFIFPKYWTSEPVALTRQN